MSKHFKMPVENSEPTNYRHAITHFAEDSLGYLKDMRMRDLLKIRPGLYEFLIIENEVDINERICACFNEQAILVKVNLDNGRSIFIPETREPDYYLEIH